jgi:signal transduction histidine kinase
MSLLPALWLPTRIGTQIAALAVAVIVIGHILITVMFIAIPPPRQPNERMGLEAALVAAVRLIDEASTPEAAAQMVAAAARAYPDLHIMASTDARASSAAVLALPRSLIRALGSEFTLRRTGEDSHDTAGLAIRLHSGLVVTAILPLGLLEKPPLFGPVVITVVFLVVLITLFSIWAMRGIVAPLSRFAAAAEHFDPDSPYVPLPEGGPEEIRKAATAFNRMRDRIFGMIEDRTQMLAAISHDLRTPITRLRLQAEFVPDKALRAQMGADLDQMNMMVRSALSFLKAGQPRRDLTPLDLSSVLETICHQFADAGANVAYDGIDRCTVEGREEELHRAVTNLVDNAIKFGGNAVIRLRVCADRARIDVEDNGPGIPDAEKASVLNPFVRGDAARTMYKDSGFGLGLSIALAIAKSHRGELKLLDRVPGGLISRLELPLADASKAEPDRVAP